MPHSPWSCRWGPPGGVCTPALALSTHEASGQTLRVSAPGLLARDGVAGPPPGGAHVLSGPAPMLQSHPAHSSPSHPATQGPRASGHWEPGCAPAAGRAPDVSSPEPVLPRPAWPRRARALAGFTDSNAARIARCKRKRGQRTLLETCPGVVSDPPMKGDGPPRRHWRRLPQSGDASVRLRQAQGTFKPPGSRPAGSGWQAGGLGTP